MKRLGIMGRAASRLFGGVAQHKEKGATPTENAAPDQCRALQTQLPPLLKTGEGQRVRTRAQWEKQRRPQVLALLEQYEYGALPQAAQPRMELGEAVYLSEKNVWLRAGQVVCAVGGEALSFAVLLYTAYKPGAQRNAQPVVLALSAFGSMFWSPQLTKSESFFPAQRLVEAGFVAVCIRADDVAQEGWKSTLFSQGSRTCGAIALWAGAAMQARSCLAQLPEVDARRIHLTGCSRAGKAALWAAAQDTAFASVAVNVTGCGGAAITRNKTGERVADITRRFPDWFALDYAQFAETEMQLPFDQHFLLALLAPRPLYIASASEDTWSDPDAEFAACVAASSVWKLYGRAGLTEGQRPQPDTPMQKGTLWYHNRSGAHGLEGYDWAQYLLFWKSNLFVQMS